MKLKLAKLFLLVNLRVRLILLVLIAVIPALGLTFYSAAEQRQNVTHTIQEDAFDLASFVTADQKHLINESRQLLVSLAYLSDLNGNDRAGCDSILKNLLLQNGHYSALGLANPQGEVVCGASTDNMPNNISGWAFFQQALQKQQFLIGDFKLSTPPDQFTIDFGYPIYDSSGNLQSLVYATANVHWINTLTSEIRFPQDTSLLVVDTQGSIQFRYPDAVRWTGQTIQNSPLAAAILDQKTGVIQTNDIDGINRLFAFSPITASPDQMLYLSVGISTGAAFAEANQGMVRNLVALGIVTLLALLAALLVGEFFILRPVRVMSKTTQALMEGNFHVRTGLPPESSELNQLAGAFDQVINSLEQRELERKSDERFIHQQNRDLGVLNGISSAISTSLEIPEIVTGLEKQLKSQLGIPAGAVFTYREAGDQFLLEKSWGLSEEIVEHIFQFSATAYHYNQVVRQKDVFYRPTLHRLEPYASLGLEATHLEWRYLCIPLLAKRDVLGVIDIFNPLNGDVNENDLQLFKAIGQQAGVVMQNARLFEQIRIGHERLRRLSNQVLEAQEAERRHISRELHDEIGQSLTAMKVNLQTLLQNPESAPLSASLEENINLIDREIKQVRALSLDLRPSMLDDLGVVAAIRWYVDRQAQRAGFKATFTTDPVDIRLTPDMETTCFRVVQEAITNVIRHAQAKNVQIELNLHEHDLELVIQDDGIGFDVQAVKERGVDDSSLGLVGMDERVQLLGGTITIVSKVNEGFGTEIRAIIPIDPEGQINGQPKRQGLRE